MARSTLYFRVEVEHDEDEDTSRIAGEIERVLMRLYGVRTAELNGSVSAAED